MQLLTNKHIKYIDNKFFVEKLDVKSLVEDYGTPLYIYSYNQIVDNYKKLRNTFDKIFPKLKIYYASKANTNISIIKIFHDLGAGIDVNSHGEMYKAMKAGVKPEEMIFSGVGKTAQELKFGIDNGIHFFKCESFSEIKLLNQIAEKSNKKVNYAIRINPDVDAHTTSHITTGTYLNKFGILIEDVIANIELIKSLKFAKLKYLSLHLGSQIFDVESYNISIDRILKLIDTLKQNDIVIEEVDLGGGFGVSYQPDGREFPLEIFANIVYNKFSNLEINVSIEPGRYLIADSAILVTKILYFKKNRDKYFYIVDAGMNDMMRPALYESYHHIQPVHIKENEFIKADVVGPVCESTDAFAKGRFLYKSAENDLLAIMTTGAYGAVMASNYNGRLKPAEILIKENQVFVIKEREDFDSLIKNEKLIN